MTAVAARNLKTGEWIRYRGERVERVTRVVAGPRGYTLVRTDRCDRTVKSATPVERVATPEWAGGPSLIESFSAAIKADQDFDAACRTR